ncbi:MAG: DUF3179 domain-containing protein [Rhizobiales bacterium]|nr:DUF3179 domain-containing protein [Hyphomicrobiales bacterium]
MILKNYQSVFAFILLAILALSGPANANPEIWQRNGWSETDFSRSSIDFSEILSGGPPKDGIPAIDDPQFVSAQSVTDLEPEEPVITLKIGDDARAYPLGILIWHEIVNDIVGGQPVTITYCPLCNSAMVFDRRVSGRVLDFGTTGKLRNSDLVMYDRQTQSWWQQFTGEAIVGTLTGVKLETIPVRLESFERFLQANPGGRVLVPNNPQMRRYGQNPYQGYDNQSRPNGYFFQGELPDYINPMARVVAIKHNGQEMAVALEMVRRDGSVNFGDVTIRWIEGQNSALDASDISEGRDVGNIIVQVTGPDGPVDIVYDVTFAFVFHAFHPEYRILQN